MIHGRPVLLVWANVFIVLLAPAIACGAQVPAPKATTNERAHSRTSSPASRQDEGRAHRQFERNALGAEFGMGLLGEAWNLNNRREWLVDGNLSVWWAFVTGAALVVEFHATRVFQQPSRAAFVNGITPLLRWRLRETRAGSWFVEVGPGISWSDTTVPPRGTRFNYLLQAGAGFSHRVGGQVDAIVGFRLLHISNNGREGRSRNPDIEALGGYAGVSVAF